MSSGIAETDALEDRQNCRDYYKFVVLRKFCSTVLQYFVKKKRDEHETAILTMAVVTAMWGSSANGDACLWVTIL